MPDPIATLIRNERQRRAQTQTEAAAEMRVCQTSISSWERGETVPAFRLRGRVARWLRMTVHGVTDACLVGLAGMRGKSENNNQREEGEMGEKTKVMTTEDLRAHIQREHQVAAGLRRHGHAYDRRLVERAVSDVEDIALPIAEERDALRAENERLRKHIIDIVNASEETTDRSDPAKYEEAMQRIAHICYEEAGVDGWTRDVPREER